MLFTRKHLLLFLILLQIEAFAQDISEQRQILHPYIGDIIDTRERAYYNLFWNVRNFRSAAIIKTESGYSARIKYLRDSKEMERSVRLSSDDIIQMRENISRRGPVPVTFMYQPKVAKWKRWKIFKRK